MPRRSSSNLSAPTALDPVKAGAEAFDVKVVLYGYNEFKKLLKEFDPELRKAMDREIRGFITPVSKLAQSYVPSVALESSKRPNSSGWRKAETGGEWVTRLGWDQPAVVKGIKVRQGGKRSKGTATSAAWKITNASAAGAVYELAGKKSDGNGVAGAAFIAGLTRTGGRPSRLIWRAWDAKGGEKAISASVVEVVNKYENTLQRALDAAGKD